MNDLTAAGLLADQLIASEVTIQDKMWGEGNDRADALKGQMQDAAMAQIGVVVLKRQGAPSETAVNLCKEEFYPSDWDGFRDYGSDVANLAVAAAYCRSEIKRKIAAGEDTHRAKRVTPYTTATPAVSSEEAARVEG
jgi:hypothetical protein